uniref:Uncharacterized protein n=1 Tax=Lygus hesperus TaxID=30085 RepID=A0A0A9YPE1_LYGHE
MENTLLQLNVRGEVIVKAEDELRAKATRHAYQLRTLHCAAACYTCYDSSSRIAHDDNKRCLLFTLGLFLLLLLLLLLPLLPLLPLPVLLLSFYILPRSRGGERHRGGSVLCSMQSY